MFQKYGLNAEITAVNNNSSISSNNNLMYKVPVCRGTLVALAGSSNCVDRLGIDER